ncbi:hypothetical protein KP509_29G084400 [Ceratopteris richardii]|uniref:Pentatricopeptide repeat-containing protein n=1 Tax=Ceratopteris richardii TaxID=49495 RepID=A0A8T2R8N9_CERRI|nr:hypothetical protein KP509_29G084400 [Ceratopteris richardii]
MEGICKLHGYILLRREFPNEVTFASLLSLHETGLTLRNGRRLHSCLQNFLLENDVLVANAIISMYGKCGHVDNARWVFDKGAGKIITARSFIYNRMHMELKKPCICFEHEQMWLLNIRAW